MDVDVYAIAKDGLVSLIDTGSHFPGVFTAIESCLNDKSCSITDIDEILVTPYHADHCGLADAIQDRSGARIYMHVVENGRCLMDEEALAMFMCALFLHGGLPLDMFNGASRSLKMSRDTIRPFEKRNFPVAGKC